MLKSKYLSRKFLVVLVAIGALTYLDAAEAIALVVAAYVGSQALKQGIVTYGAEKYRAKPASDVVTGFEEDNVDTSKVVAGK